MAATTTDVRDSSPPMFSARILSCLKEPGAADDADLTLEGGGLRGVNSGKLYPFVDGNVPSLFVGQSGDGEQVTTDVKSFYEENPFPSYEGLEEFGQLVHKGSSNSFSSTLLEAVGYNKNVLECGCGTGQLSHYLQLNNNHVLGIDMSISSLKLAIEHKLHNGLPRSSFAQMNIFNLAIKDNSFDVVISHGVLHHTFDARKAFAQIVRKAKPGGIVMVGLYNYYARVPTYLRSKVIGLTGGKIDYVVRNRIRDERKADIWIKDQYYNPHETWHSIDEVLGWFKDNDIEYLNTSPPILGSGGEATSSLFAKSDPAGAYQRVVTQLSWLGTIAREGALFDVIGRKKGAS
jgi:SAM-dependent methyltransferase